MSTEPTTINRAQLRGALAALGIGDHQDVKSVEILPETLRIVRYRHDENGHRFAAGDEAATVTTVAAIDWDDEEVTTR